MIQLAKGLELPASAATQTFAFMGKRGAGKTYGAGKLAEELFDAGVQVIVIDCVGNWWGLRVAADGKGAGLAIPVLGGDHGDLPLVPGAGALVADLAVDTGQSLVLDLMHFKKTERQRFVTDFAEHLFHRKKTARSPLHLIVEEAHKLVPQKVYHGEERMLGAMEDLIRLGRNYGIGASLLDQRPQSVNKDVLNQTECLLAFQLIGAQERKAIELWAEDKGIGKGEVRRLSTLEQGQAILWSPTWLKRFDVVTIGKKRTLDASSTPEVGAKASARTLAAIDTAKLAKAMAAVVEEIKADDPKALRKRIAELERDLRAKAPPPAPVPRAVDLAPVLKALRAADLAVDAIARAVDDVAKAQMSDRHRMERVAQPSNGRDRLGHPEVNRAPARSRPTDESLGKGPRLMLEALASMDPKPLSKAAASVLAGYSPRSSTVRNILSALRVAGYITGGDLLSLTPEGRAAAGDVPQPRTTRELVDHWTGQLGKGPREVLRLLVERYPDELSKDDIEAETGYSASSSTMRNILSKLRSTGLLVGSGEVRASDFLFQGGGP